MEVQAILHIWCIFFTGFCPVGILQVGVRHVNMQAEAWWEEKLSDGSVDGSLTRLCKIIKTNRRPVDFTPAAVAVQRHSDSCGGDKGTV